MNEEYSLGKRNLKYKQAVKKVKRNRNGLVHKPNRKRSEREAEKQLKKVKRVFKIVSNGFFFLFAVFCLLFLIKMKAHMVEGQSMNPTLNHHDYILVSKKKKPERYDIITFAPQGKPKESYVKRVIGLPGDTIWTDRGFLFINHQISDETTIPYNGNQIGAVDLPDGTVKINLAKEAYDEMRSLQIIPEGNYFVLGDNRNHSNDSRQFGLVSSDQIEGVMVLRYFPLNQFGAVK
ncbi:signal peptidase I [Enterococcus caccae]|uniref:Signal peptidase I n=1 Tax=Enterococcus caccae ATCC BAA-1240 TaxID=1158612 RepID=R3U9E7_9ENTE|nr:signal peptidase I [Enterococcus caccae]EOL50088.1 signal peptidase I [Enterococcus caccae ATCC BAA-1240]EOT56182.1 signal peptidase I [Enterococcus caccae ATCC BAA-1240]OJG25462.1 signal peptidase I [Enterococcus caccae]